MGKAKAQPVRGTPPGALRIVRIPISRINVATYNPRQPLQPGQPAYERLRRSIDTFGYVDPLVWNRRTGNLVGGHQRLPILTARGATELDVSEVDLPPAQERALALVLNKAQGEWDQVRLAALLTELRDGGEVALADAGFDDAEVAALLSRRDLDCAARLVPLDVRPPPRTTWVLVGIPTRRYGEIADMVDRIAGLPDVLCEVSASDADANG